MSSVWAVARNTISQAVRMKVALVVIVLLVLLIPVMSVTFEGDRTLLGKLQTFTSYGLSLTGILLSLMTITISTFTLTNDLKRKHIFLLATKPIYRYQIILGKILGVIILNSILLAVFSVIIYSLTIWTVKDVEAENEKDQTSQKKVIAGQIQAAKREFFVARNRRDMKIDEEAILERAVKRYNELKEQGQLPETMLTVQIMAELTAQERNLLKSIPRGTYRRFEFDGVKVSDPNSTIYVRHKMHKVPASFDYDILAEWRLGDFRQVDESGRVITNIKPFIIRTIEDTYTYNEFEAPSSVVAPDGYVSVDFNNNIANSGTIVLDDLQVLYKTGSFTGNYYKAVLLILVRLIFLAVVGISISTWLSFPVAIFVCLIVFCTGLVNGFIVESIESLSTVLNIVYMFTIRPILWLLPKFDGDYNPSKYIVEGRTITWLFLGQVYLFTVVVKSFLVLLLGIFVFSNRELAKISA